MKPFLAAFLLLSTAVILEAGETPPALRKFRLVYTDAAHQLAEAEVQSLSNRVITVLPLWLPSKSMWICSVTVDQPENTVSFDVQTPDLTSEASAGQSKTPQTILDVTMPLRNGEEMVLVKSTAFTLSATVTLPAVPKEGEPAPETPSLALTEDELKKVVFKTRYISDSINFTGYNPFGKRLGEGILRVTVPKTGDTPEIVRDYAVRLNASGLADFWSSVSAGLGIPKGVEPTCQLVKLNFLE